VKSKYILGVDQGTTGSTALIFDLNGAIVGKGYSEFSQIYPKAGWVEHNPEELYSITLKVIQNALQSADLDSSSLLGMGITNQRETTVVWNKETGKPIANAIVWQCRRTSDQCKKMKKEEPWVRKLTGLVLDPYFSATKVQWLLNNVEGALRKAERGTLLFGNIDSWLIWKLTQGKAHVTDPTNASRTMLYDIQKQVWSKELCKLFSVPMQMLPEVRKSSGPFGETNELGSPVPILGVAGDQQSALFGHFATEIGQAKCTFGTGAFMLSQLGNKMKLSKHGLLTTLTCDKNGNSTYGLEGSIFMAGAIIQWLRDGIKIIGNASETEEIARSVRDTGGVVLIPAFVGLGAPHWKPDARAALFGMTRGTSRAHIVRAALNAIALQTYELAEAMNRDLPKKLKELRVDGGATANSYLMEMLAGLLKIPILRPNRMEMTAFGAARLAAIHLGYWKNEKELASKEKHFLPNLSPQVRKTILEEWEVSIQKVLT
jgi:glycerol kinase